MKFVIAFVTMLVSVQAFAQTPSGRFADVVGPISVEPVKETESLDLRWLTWGGDVPLFVANGGVKTTPDSLYGKAGLKVNLGKGDDFVQGVRDYMIGKTPFLRGTLDMIGQASEVIGSDPRTKPVVFLQLTWSAGDHIVARENIKTLNDLVRTDRKVRIACQQGGPHVGLLFKALLAAQANIQNIEIVWTQDLTGPKGPAELFRKDSTIDAACVITPDMLGLTGGLESKGSGSEGTVKGAHVVVSTQQMSRATADVLVVRSDWYQSNKDKVEKIVAGYLAATEKVVALRKNFNETNKLSVEYRAILTVAQTQFGKDVIPTLEIDGHGLLLDATFVGLPGQVSFFQDKGNLNGFEPSQKLALDLATSWGYAKVRSGFTNANLDYQNIAKLAGIQYVAPTVSSSRIVAESTNLFPDSNLDDRTILTFTINFEPEQDSFSVDQYGAEFNRVVQNASVFGNAVIVIRGHSDPTKTLVDFLRAGMAKGIIKRSGDAGNYVYYFNGKVLDLNSTDDIVQLVKGGAFDGVNPSPRETMQAALNLSQSRAEAVKNAISKFATEQKVNFDVSQIQPQGAGIIEPLIAKPKNIEEAKKNMRVEFKVVKVPAEAIKQSDFDF
jgi:hypothetical protein